MTHKTTETIYCDADRESCNFLACREGNFFLLGNIVYRLNVYNSDFLYAHITRVGRMTADASRREYSDTISALTLHDMFYIGHAEWLPEVYKSYVVESEMSRLPGRRLHRELSIESLSVNLDGVMTVYFLWRNDRSIMLREATLCRFLKEVGNKWIQYVGYSFDAVKFER